MFCHGLADTAKLIPVGFLCAEIKLISVREHQKEQIVIFGIRFEKCVERIERLCRNVPAGKRHLKRIGRKSECRSAYGNTRIAYARFLQRLNMAGALENVGMAKPGKDGIYNVMIMEEREDIVALGAGAASKKVRPDGAGGIQITRCENVKDIRNYIDRVDEMIERKNLLFSDL